MRFDIKRAAGHIGRGWCNQKLPDKQIQYVTRIIARNSLILLRRDSGTFGEIGTETPKAVEAIRAALAARTTFTIDLLNYRKSG